MWILDSRRVDYEHPHSPLRNPLELFVAHPSIHAASQPAIHPASHPSYSNNIYSNNIPAWKSNCKSAICCIPSHLGLASTAFQPPSRTHRE